MPRPNARHQRQPRGIHKLVDKNSISHSSTPAADQSSMESNETIAAAGY
jgi:hypothetical protein